MWIGREILPRVSPLNNPCRLDQLIKIQNRISKKMLICQCTQPELIAGIDVANKEQILIAGIVILTYPQLELIETTWAADKAPLPYIPNFLAFREMPVILKAYHKLKHKPDLIFIDGQGIAHPRRCGIATHLGVILDKPVIGCAKSHLFGEFVMPGRKRGDWRFLLDDGQIIGVVLRTRDGVRPVFVSPGHRVDFLDCINYVLNTSRFRIPEPTRLAHIFAEKIKGVPYVQKIKSSLSF
ncbi:MAG: deoxyribonuclease V [candidate division WOR-3 bacterium]